MNKKDWMQTLLSLGLVLPGVAQAIGLGNLVVLSGPGEPFRAEIPIHGAHQNQLADLNAQLADSAAYAMIHLPFAPATRNWQFSVRPGDKPAIVISSPTPLPPGATPFLVQLDWAGGQMVREYQAYPGTYNVPQQTALPMPAPLQSKTPAAATPTPSSSTGWSKVGHYGPVPKGSSLFQIAQQLNDSAQVSQQQAMAALFKANPGAFIQGDPSRLIAGVTLKVPSIHEVRALSPLQAATLLQRKEQVAAPATAKAQPVASTTAVAASSASATPVDSSGKVATALSLTSAPAVSATQSAELTPAVTATASATSAVANPDQAEIETLQKSLKGVETRLAVAQQQLAAQAMEISKMSRNQASSFPPLLWVSLGGNLLLLLLFIWMYRRQEQAASRQREISSKLTALGSATRSMPPAAAAPAPAATPAPAPAPAPAPVAESAASAPAVTPTKSPVATPASTPVPEASLAMGAAVAESSAPEEPAAQAAEVQEMGDNRDGFDVDPLEQADLYQTYGKTEQAINVLQEALESNPRRREVYVRLLTLYADADRRSDFLDLAERMRSRFGPNNSDWQEIAAKGRALFPGNALFAEEKSESAERPVPAASTLELSKPEANLEPSQPAEAEIEKLDFDLSSWGNQAEPQNEDPAWTDAHQKMLDEVNEQFRALDEDSRPALRLADDTENGMGAAAPAPETPLPAGGKEVSPQQEQVANATDWDAVGTKLDLAKAYVEMGDGEAARELLTEVQRDGNPAQQEEATKLLANG